jgi:hypothetical protein
MQNGKCDCGAKYVLLAKTRKRERGESEFWDFQNGQDFFEWERSLRVAAG